MDLNLETLAIQNPWWQGHSLKFDPVLMQYARNRLKWRPAVFDKLNFKRDGIHCLFGSRGTGKTTLLKLSIKKLLEEGIEPRRIFYYSCQNLDSFEQLNEMVKLFLNSANGKRTYLFIDEICALNNWQKGLEHLKLAGKLKNATAVLACSVEDDDGDDSRGERLKLSGMSFAEFVSLANPKLFKSIKPNNYPEWKHKIEYYLDVYLLTGGWPAAINDYEKNGAVSQGVYANYLYWFLAAVARQGRDTVLIRQIMEKIIFNLGQAVGYQTLAKKTKARTHLTAAEYLNLLERMFVVKTVYQADGSPEGASRKAKKVFFTDLFLFWLFYAFTHGSLDYWRLARERLHDSAVFSHVLENAVLSQLIKNEENKISYWRDNARKLEINFLVQHGHETTPILIKYDKEIKQPDFDVFQSAGHKRGIIISKNQLAMKNKIKIMPLAYFLMFGAGS